jgi:catalase
VKYLRRSYRDAVFRLRRKRDLLGMKAGVPGTCLRWHCLSAGRPEAIGSFLATHPNAKRFIEAPKPVPTNFAREAFFAVTSFKFTNAAGVSRHDRFRIRPAAGTEYLSNETAATKSPNFLFDELGPRLDKAPVKLGLYVQIAEPDDDVAVHTL